MARALKPLTTETLQDEVRFLLKTLLRDDLFGDEVGVVEAEKLLESSLSVGFVEYCALLKRQSFIDIDRARNTIVVLPRGRHFADGTPDPSLVPALAAQFAARLGPATAAPATALPPQSTSPPVMSSPASAGFGGAAGVLRGRPLGLDEQKKAAALATIAMLDRERYVRGEILGQGSLGNVLAARDATLERDVVVKEVRHIYDLVTYVPKEEITARVRKAVMAQARLDHPHILRVVDVQFSGDVPTIILDRAAKSLATRMARGLMPVEVVLRVLMQIAYALSHAHRHDIVHGGLKPENVLFDGAGNVRLADFGIARVAERSSSEPASSAPPVYVGRGHPSYMAPEQLHKGRVIPQADIYALGILLYEMLTGNLPGRRSPMPSSSERVVAAVGKDRIEALDDLFDRMTRDPLHERFSSVDDVLEHLYGAFPAALVGQRGTLMLSEVDPLPPSSVPAEFSGDDDESPSSGRAEATLVTRQPSPPEA